MTDHELQMLFVGVALGAQGVSLLHAYWSSKDASRSEALTQAAIKRAAGDCYLSSLRLYQLQHRSRV